MLKLFYVYDIIIINNLVILNVHSTLAIVKTYLRIRDLPHTIDITHLTNTNKYMNTIIVRGHKYGRCSFSKK